MFILDCVSTGAGSHSSSLWQQPALHCLTPAPSHSRVGAGAEEWEMLRPRLRSQRSPAPENRESLRGQRNIGGGLAGPGISARQHLVTEREMGSPALLPKVWWPRTVGCWLLLLLSFESFKSSEHDYVSLFHPASINSSPQLDAHHHRHAGSVGGPKNRVEHIATTIYIRDMINTHQQNRERALWGQ